MVRNFFNQFTSVVKDQMKYSNQIYLVDILDQLNFISVDAILRSSPKINMLFKQQGKNFMIDTHSGQFGGESEDITKNLFKICCAILNLRPK